MCTSSDTPAEIELVKQRAKEAGAADAVESTHWADGGVHASMHQSLFLWLGPIFSSLLLFSLFFVSLCRSLCLFVYLNCSLHAGAGAKALAEAVVKATEQPADFKLLYELDLSIEEKIEKICKEVYRADGISISGWRMCPCLYCKSLRIFICVLCRFLLC